IERMPGTAASLEWLVWDGERLSRPMLDAVLQETEVHPYIEPDATLSLEAARILKISPSLLRAVPSVGGSAISIRLRGLEVACVRAGETSYPLGEPLADVVTELAAVRKFGTGHPLARSHEERWLESNIV